MKKILLLAFICLFFAFNLSAQKIAFGAENESESSDFSLSGLLGKFDNSYFVMMREKKTYFIQRYALNDNIKMDKKVDIGGEIDGFGNGYKFSYMSKNIIHVFYIDYDKKEKSQRIFLQDYDETLTKKGALRTLVTIGGRNKREPGKFRLLKSPTGNKICLIGEDNFKDDDPQKFTMNVYDALTMEEEWSKKVTLPYTDKLFVPSSFNITDEGTVSILGLKFNEKLKNKKDGKVNYTFEAFVYTKENNGQQKTISLGETTYMSNVRLFLSKTNAFNIIGFYGDNPENITGIFTIAFDKEMNNIGTDKKPFSADFLATFTKKSKKGIFRFDITTISEDDNGNFKVLAEWLYNQTRNYRITDKSSGFTRNTYINMAFNMDIMVISLDKNLKVSDKMQKISKEQRTMAKGGEYSPPIKPNTHSYVTYKNGNNLYLLYNDNIKNKDFICSNKIKRMNDKPSFFMVKIDADNNLKKEELLGKLENKFLVHPKLSKQINEKEVLIYAERGKKYSFGIIKFE